MAELSGHSGHACQNLPWQRGGLRHTRTRPVYRFLRIGGSFVVLLGPSCICRACGLAVCSYSSTLIVIQLPCYAPGNQTFVHYDEIALQVSVRSTQAFSLREYDSACLPANELPASGIAHEHSSQHWFQHIVWYLLVLHTAGVLLCSLAVYCVCARIHGLVWRAALGGCMSVPTLPCYKMHYI